MAVPIIGNALRFVFFLATGGRSSNGRTPDSGSGYLGSNPSLPAKLPIASELIQLAFGLRGSRLLSNSLHFRWYRHSGEEQSNNASRRNQGVEFEG